MSLNAPLTLWGIDFCPECGTALEDAQGASWPYCPSCLWPPMEDE